MKVIASILVFMLTMTHFNMLGTVIAASLENQTQQTNHANVEFDAYFMEESKKVHTTQNTIGEQNYLYTYFNVKEAGYLKNIIVQAVEPNFTIGETENSQIAKIEENKLYFNQIKNGEPLEVAIPIQNRQAEQVTLEEFNKESTIKLTATYVDGKGKEKQIEKEVKVQLAWTSEKQAELNMQIAKFIPYDLNGNKGLVLQTLVQSYLKENTLPVQEDKIEITVPTINNCKPQSVKVMANTTKATNGEEIGQTFTEENYAYDEETNKLTITVKNEKNEQGQIAWSKSAQDEFVVTYVYPEEVLKAITENGVKISMVANSQLTIYEANQTKVQKEFAEEVTLKEQVDNLVDFSVETNVEELSKGQIYANYNTSKKLETEYQETLVANIGLADLTDKIILEQKVDQFVNQQDVKVQATQTYDKSVTISQAQINKILGEEAEVSFYIGNTQIAKIDKETKADEQGNFVISLAEYNTNTLRIETSKPQAEGKLAFVITKALKGEIGYNQTQVTSFHKLEQNVIGTAINAQTKFVEQTATKEVALTETTSQAELVIDNANLSTVVSNQNVKLTAILKSDSLNCSLFHNPSLQIILPTYIEAINIKNIEVFFDTEGSKLALQSYNILTNQDGSKTISILLEGTQTEYTLGAVSKGVNVVITTDITVNKLTANKQDQIRMVYTNNNGKAKTAETNEVFANINVVAPVGLVTTTTVSNYKDNALDLTAMTGEEKIAMIATLSPQRSSTFTMNIINNYNNPIDNITILGRFPTQANTDPDSLQELGSTISLPLLEALAVNGLDPSQVSIYYSQNSNATNDIALPANGWSQNLQTLQNVKSYLIVVNHSFNTAENFSFSYSVQIPANLQHNQSAFENFVVYFDNHLPSGLVHDKQIASKVGISTGKGPVLETQLSSDTEETKELQKDDIVKLNLAVTNIGTELTEEAKATISIPEGLQLIQENKELTSGYETIANAGNYTISLGDIAIGQTITKELLMRVTSVISKDKMTVETSVEISANNIEGMLNNIEPVKHTLVKSYYNVVTTTIGADQVLREGQTFDYYISILANDYSQTLQNNNIEIEIPNELQYQKVQAKQYKNKQEVDISNEITANYNEKTRKLTISLGDLNGKDAKIIYIQVAVATLPDNVYDKILSTVATVSGQYIETNSETKENLEKTARTQTINFDEVEVGKVGFRITQSCNIPQNATIGGSEDFTYTFTIENLSNINLTGVQFTDLLPDSLNFGNIVATLVQTTRSSYDTDENGNPTISFNIGGRQTITIDIHVTASLLDQNAKIQNKAKISYEGIEDIFSNEISHTIEKFDESLLDNSSSNTGSAGKRIMGTVWLDENRNGTRDEEEQTVAGVTTYLFNNATGTLVTDLQGNPLKSITQEDGIYTFANVPQGSYTVIFLYDTVNYSATTYQLENVSEEQNSDAIDSKIFLDGIETIAAITEQISLSDSNIYNIDLGLIDNPKFDLKLEKMVSKITVQNSTGTKTYDFQNEKLARVEIVGNQVSSSTIVVEYKIKVTNEGAISGFVKKIADYLPSEMKFSSELNKDWYTSDNGVLYNASLANTMINPGESKEVTLILTKKMTENNLGLYHNEAEIYEAYNDLGIADVDSVPANKASTEDDFSSADVLTSVKTGETILFIGLSISIITTIGISAYFAKKYLFRTWAK